MEGVASLHSPFTIQSVGGPLIARLSFSLDRGVGLVSHVTDGGPVPEDVEEVLRTAYADVLVIDHGLFAAAWTSVQDSEPLVAEHDRLVQAVLATYAPRRIVLLRSSIRRFYWAGASVLPRRYPDDRRDVDALREFLDRLDARFQQATGCAVVEAPAQLPSDDGPAHDPMLSTETLLAVEDAALAAARDGAPMRPIHDRPAESVFAAAVHRALLLEGVGPDQVLNLLPDGGLSTYEDVAALAAAFVTDRDADWSAVAIKALPASGAVREARLNRIEANTETLRGHPHVYIPGASDLVSNLARTKRLVSRLCRSWFLMVEPAKRRAIQLRNYGRRGTFDVQAFCDADYVCAPDQIDSALESWEAYFERGRRGDTAPFRLSFPNPAAFQESLEFLDYADILANENYCLTIDAKVPSDITWRARVDTSFLFEPRTRVCQLDGGFGDQLFRYAETYAVTERHGLRLFLDDLWFDNTAPRLRWSHARPDIIGLAKAEGVFSQIFSRRLRHRRRVSWPYPFDRREYAELGLPEQVLIVNRARAAYLLTRSGASSVLVVPLTVSLFERAIAEPVQGVTFIDVLAKSKYLDGPGLRDKDVWERCLTWPRFLSRDAAALAEHMMASDAIVVHVRRGDRAELGIADSDEYYRGFLSRIAVLDEFTNKHLFVFSDDLQYCREHRHELGLDMLGEAVSFVEGNRHFASIDDFHLMSLGKVVVCGLSAFSSTAALVSTRVEYIYGEGYGADGGDTWHRTHAGT